MAEPKPSKTMHHDAVSAPTSNSEATTEHVMTVNNLGTVENNSTEVDSNLAMAPESNPKFPEDKTKLDVIAVPDSMEQVSPLCRICKEGKTRDEDPLICLGCSCPSDLRQAHRSCIKVYFGRRVKRGEHFCRLCRTGKESVIECKEVMMNLVIQKIQPKLVGFKGIRIYPTPPPLSDHHVEMQPTPDELNARRAEEEALHKREMFERFEQFVLIVLIVLIFVLLTLLVFLLMTRKRECNTFVQILVMFQLDKLFKKIFSFLGLLLVEV